MNGITALEYFGLSKLSLPQPSDPELSVISDLFQLLVSGHFRFSPDGCLGRKVVEVYIDYMDKNEYYVGQLLDSSISMEH